MRRFSICTPIVETAKPSLFGAKAGLDEPTANTHQHYPQNAQIFRDFVCSRQSMPVEQLLREVEGNCQAILQILEVEGAASSLPVELRGLLPNPLAWAREHPFFPFVSDARRNGGDRQSIVTFARNVVKDQAAITRMVLEKGMDFDGHITLIRHGAQGKLQVSFVPRK